MSAYLPFSYALFSLYHYIWLNVIVQSFIHMSIASLTLLSAHAKVKP